MAEIFDLERFRRKLAADKGFRSWLSRFQEQFGADTRLKDLSAQTLNFLASPGEDNLFILFDLIMGSQGLGSSVRFRWGEMDAGLKLKIIDTALLIMDRVRFEVMRRLGWVEGVPDEDTPLIGLVGRAWKEGAAFAGELPRLSKSHPDYESYSRLAARDQGILLRRQIPRAVAAFQAQTESSEK